MEPAGVPASSRPKPCSSLGTTPKISSVHRSLLALVRRNQTAVRDQFSSQKPPEARLWFWRAQGFSTYMAHRQRSFPPASPNLVLPGPALHAGTRLRMLRRPARLSVIMPPVSCVPFLPEGHQNWSSEGAHLVNTILNQPSCRRV